MRNQTAAEYTMKALSIIVKVIPFADERDNQVLSFSYDGGLTHNMLKACH